MTAAPEGDLRSLLYLAPLRAVAAAPTAGFFGAAYLMACRPEPSQSARRAGPAGTSYEHR